MYGPAARCKKISSMRAAWTEIVMLASMIAAGAIFIGFNPFSYSSK